MIIGKLFWVLLFLFIYFLILTTLITHHLFPILNDTWGTANSIQPSNTILAPPLPTCNPHIRSQLPFYWDNCILSQENVYNLEHHMNADREKESIFLDGNYQLLGDYESGMQAQLYPAMHLPSNQKVAIKFHATHKLAIAEAKAIYTAHEILHRIINDPKSSQMLKEMKNAIPKVYSTFAYGGSAKQPQFGVVVMEYIDGVNIESTGFIYTVPIQTKQQIRKIQQEFEAAIKKFLKSNEYCILNDGHDGNWMLRYDFSNDIHPNRNLHQYLVRVDWDCN